MQINIEDNDQFNKKIRQRLEDFQTPVDPAVWEAIEAKMGGLKTKKRFALGWWFGSGMAAAVALLLLFSPTMFINDKKLVQYNTQQKNIVNNELLKHKQECVNNQKEKQKKQTRNNLTSSPFILNKVTVSSTKMQVSDTNDSLPTKDNNYIAQNSDVKIQKQIVETKTDTTQIKTAPVKKEIPEYKQNSWDDPIKDKNNEGWELIAMVGGIGKSSENTNTVFRIPTFAPRSGIVEAKTVNTNIFSPEDFSNKTYLAPISAGIVVAKKLSSKLALETGINYTYLLTMFKNNLISANLNLHYLGVPAKITYKISTGKKWNMYAGVGGMLEKGLWSVYQQKQVFSGQTITTTVSDNIEGVQWSLNAGIGGEYMLIKNTAIYFEPKISYYFDNDQPISIRTENNWVIGFEGGIRYKF